MGSIKQKLAILIIICMCGTYVTPAFAADAGLDVPGEEITADDGAEDDAAAEEAPTVDGEQAAEEEPTEEEPTDDGALADEDSETDGQPAGGGNPAIDAPVAGNPTPNGSSPGISANADGEALGARVVLPIDLPFTLDAYEKAGRGQLYSDVFKMQNFSDKDVEVVIESLSYEFCGEGPFVAAIDPESEDLFSKHKSIYMVLSSASLKSDILITDLEQVDVCKFLLTAPTADIDPDSDMDSEADTDGEAVDGTDGDIDGDTDSEADNEELKGYEASFEFCGIINQNPVVRWRKGDIKVLLKFRIQEPGTEQDADPVEEPIENEQGEADDPDAPNTIEKPPADKPEESDETDEPEADESEASAETEN